MNYEVIIRWKDGALTKARLLNRTEARAIADHYQRLEQTEFVDVKKVME